jgi:hypothetical protein
MNKPPAVPKVLFGLLQSPLFVPDDIPGLATYVGPLAEGMTPEAASELLDRCFNEALGHGEFEEDSPSPDQLAAFYDGAIKGARDLAKKLGLSDDVTYLLRGTPPRPPVVYLAYSPQEGVPGVVRELPYVVHELEEWLGRGIQLETDDEGPHSAIPIARLLQIAAGGLPEAELSAAVDSRLWAFSALRHANGLSVDAAALAELRLSTALHLLLPLLPRILALMIGLSERAKQVPLSISNKRPNYARGFTRTLFSELAAAHVAIFGRPPRLQNSTRAPDGSGVKWARAVLECAAERIEGASLPATIRPKATASINEAARLSGWSLASRLRAGRSAI